ncbi:dTDP-4-dehydrorhamnose 3,5-epimerase [Winogradskyella aurantiaca]|uniref:dTDP-4-dehydrorhamnose 3,5-epimerase n=1 Tax=Winogradskyella aurantiaca TaxID=2219558 RepID=UPI000E1D40BE|nr:dTDP-4-dehydrorhamnose 3,5-epimerase [Winogradskyella aurantiaca]
MKIEKTPLEGSVLFKPKVFEDHRGYFFESFKAKVLVDNGLDFDFVQDNESKSQKGVLRGLHYQKGPHAQAKLVRVIAGSVLDVIVDMRPASSTFGEHFKVILSEQNKWQLLVPRGFAHGFLVLEDNTIFSYKCDNYYHKESERGVLFSDEDLNIDWGMTNDALILSEKDLLLPKFKDADI